MATPIFHDLSLTLRDASSHNVSMADAQSGHLREWRTFRGFSQEKLAEELGTSVGQVSMLENGKRGLTLKWLERIAPILDTTPGRILDTDPTEMGAEIIDIWDHIPMERREQAKDILKTFATGG